MTSADKLGESFTELFPTLEEHVTSHHGSIAGPRYGKYYSFTDEGVDLEAGIVVQDHVRATKDIKPGELTSELVASIEYTGPYIGLTKAWREFMSEIFAQKYRVIGTPYEIYWLHAFEEKDAAKWRTEIVAPITTT